MNLRPWILTDTQTVVGVYYRAASQDDNIDELFYVGIKGYL